VTLVVDASVAVLWVLEQNGSQRALALRSEVPLIAPSLIVAEIGNAIWKAARRGEVTREFGLTAIKAALLAFAQLVRMEDLHLRALELSIQLDHAIYDCFYLALAERERVPLVCMDGPLIEKTKKFTGIEVRAL
jgi:predicted nucleic acid-binding protein